MKYYEFKESLKRKAQNLKDIKIGLKEKQRTLHFNSYDREGNHHGWIWSGNEHLFTPEQLRRHKLAVQDYEKCLNSHKAAYPDYRARHIAYSLFRGRTPEQIENNYYPGKWDFVVYDRNKKKHFSFQEMIDKHLRQLEVDNPPKTYYHEFVDESKEVYDNYFKDKSTKEVYDSINKEFTI
jgi:hypothetical protein